MRHRCRDLLAKEGTKTDRQTDREREREIEDGIWVGMRREGRGHERIRIIANQERNVWNGGFEVRILCNRCSRHGDASANIWAPMPTHHSACVSQHNDVFAPDDDAMNGDMRSLRSFGCLQTALLLFVYFLATRWHSSFEAGSVYVC
jgi:hypothetical protein